MDQFLQALVAVLLSPDAMNFYALVVVAMGTYLGKQLLNFIILKMGQAKYDYFVKEIETVVRALEQAGIIQHLDGPAKKAQATLYAHELRDWLKLDISDEMIDNIIEAFVQVLNTEAGKFTKPMDLSALLPDVHVGELTPPLNYMPGIAPKE